MSPEAVHNTDMNIKCYIAILIHRDFTMRDVSDCHFTMRDVSDWLHSKSKSWHNLVKLSENHLIAWHLWLRWKWKESSDTIFPGSRMYFYEGILLYLYVQCILSSIAWCTTVYTIEDFNIHLRCPCSSKNS